MILVFLPYPSRREVGAKRSLLELVEAKELKRKSLGPQCLEDLEFIELDKQVRYGTWSNKLYSDFRFL